MASKANSQASPVAQQHMTAVAKQAMSVSEQLSLAFLSRTVGTAPAMRLQVAKPDGPSSEGGKKARLALSLVPTDNPLGGGVMVGWLDIAQSCAELRAHGVVASQHERRFHRPISVLQPEYDSMLEEIADMVQERGMIVQVSEEPPPGPPERTAIMGEVPTANDPQPSTGRPVWLWAVLAAAAVGAAAGLAATLL